MLVAQSCLTLCNPMDCSTPGLPVLHHLPEPAQTHVDQVSDAIQTSHPLLSPSPVAFSPSQHQGLFQWIGFDYQVALTIRWSKYWSSSFSISPSNDIWGWFPLGLTGLILLLSKGLSRVFSSTTGESINSSALSLLYGSNLISARDYWKNHNFDYMDLYQQNNVSAF